MGGGPAAPVPDLRTAAAMVYVGDLGTPVLTESDAHHLVDVLRLRAGEVVAAGDGAGSWVSCRLTSGAAGVAAPRRTAALEVIGPRQSQPPLAPDITVAFAPVKGDRPEWVVQKLTELGVDRIVPLRTVRSVVRWEGERGQRAVDRLRRVARQAAAQSRRPWLPEVAEVATVTELFGATLAEPVVAIGPEGGWDEEELVGTARVGLGPTVLRADTAAVTAGALLCGLRSELVGTLRNHAP
jgi:16S rRNA (uracil1498-N3)-methyltransferase